MHFSFLCWVNVCSGRLRQFIFYLEVKKVVATHVRPVFVLYKNDCMGNGLGKLNVGKLGQLVVL